MGNRTLPTFHFISPTPQFSVVLPVVCDKCKKPLNGQADVASAMNVPFVTDGPVYYCYDCRPVPGTAEEIIDKIEEFFSPPKEVI